jgi:hypothetical protein
MAEFPGKKNQPLEIPSTNIPDRLRSTCETVSAFCKHILDWRTQLERFRTENKHRLKKGCIGEGKSTKQFKLQGIALLVEGSEKVGR